MSEAGLRLSGKPAVILTNDAPWEGEVVEAPYILKDDAYYPQRNSIFIGREAIVDRLVWNYNGWPFVNHGNGVSGAASQPAAAEVTVFQCQPRTPACVSH